jgi:chromate reductase
MSASGGLLGGARAQYHLRQIGIFMNLRFVNRPEVMIAQAQTKFDAEGNLTDETTRGLIRDLGKALVDWTRRLKG